MSLNEQATLYLINWERAFNDVYTYGSQIEFLVNGVIKFSNPLMPPNLALKTWFSQKSFIRTHDFASLPRLVVNETYTVVMQYQVTPLNGIYWSVSCFDDQDELIITHNFDSHTGEFTYPENADHYTISLINIGHQTVEFSYLMLINQAAYNKYTVDINRRDNLVAVQPHGQQQTAPLQIRFMQPNSITATYQLSPVNGPVLIWDLNLMATTFPAILDGLSAWWGKYYHDTNLTDSAQIFRQATFTNLTAYPTATIIRLLKEEINHVSQLSEPLTVAQEQLQHVATWLNANPALSTPSE